MLLFALPAGVIAFGLSQAHRRGARLAWGWLAVVIGLGTWRSESRRR